jgi:hypothetical protein
MGARTMPTCLDYQRLGATRQAAHGATQGKRASHREAILVKGKREEIDWRGGKKYDNREVFIR